MSMTIEDLIHTAWTVCKWQISVEDPASVYNKIVYTGVIDKMPLDVYFSIRGMYVQDFSEWQVSEDEERLFLVTLTYDANSESAIVERYKQRMEREKNLKEYQAKLNSSKENEK